MKVIFVDLETTGLNESKDIIWQIAYIVAEQTENKLIIKEYSEKVLISALLLKMCNKCQKFVKKFIKSRKRIKKIANLLESSDVIVAHNVDFERRFLQEYSVRFDNSKLYCTMLNTTGLCRIKHPYFGYKWPKLSEAVEILLKDEIDKDKLHDASYDVMLTVKLYAYLRGLEVDYSQCKKNRSIELIKNIVGMAVSPIDPFLSRRLKLKRRITDLKYRIKYRIKNMIDIRNRFKTKRDNNLADDDDVPF